MYANTLAEKIGYDQNLIVLNQIKLAQMQAIITLYNRLGGGYRFNHHPVEADVSQGE